MLLRPFDGNSFSFFFFKYTRYHILLNWKAGLFYLPLFLCVLQVIVKLRLSFLSKLGWFFQPRSNFTTLGWCILFNLGYSKGTNKNEDTKFLFYFLMRSFTRCDAQSNQNWFTCSLPSSHKSSSSRWGSPPGQLSVAMACFKQVSGFFNYWSYQIINQHSQNYKRRYYNYDSFPSRVMLSITIHYFAC